MSSHGIFKKNDLKLCNLQYSIRFENVNNFIIGENVFLKSNPEVKMIVKSINKKTITTKWYTKTSEIQLCEFPPECILQYKYASLLTYKNHLQKPLSNMLKLIIYLYIFCFIRKNNITLLN